MKTPWYFWWIQACYHKTLILIAFRNIGIGNTVRTTPQAHYNRIQCAYLRGHYTKYAGFGCLPDRFLKTQFARAPIRTELLTLPPSPPFKLLCFLCFSRGTFDVCDSLAQGKVSETCFRSIVPAEWLLFREKSSDNPGQNCWHIPPPSIQCWSTLSSGRNSLIGLLIAEPTLNRGEGGEKKSFWDRLEVIRFVWLMIFRKMDKIKACVNTFCPGL